MLCTMSRPPALTRSRSACCPAWRCPSARCASPPAPQSGARCRGRWPPTAALTPRVRRSFLAAAGSLGAWPELVASLMQALDSGNVDAADGALDALFKVQSTASCGCTAQLSHPPARLQVCEEVPDQLDRDVASLPARPAALLLPRLFGFFSRRDRPCSRGGVCGRLILLPGRSTANISSCRSAPSVGACAPLLDASRAVDELPGAA